MQSPPLSRNGALAHLLADYRGRDVVALVNRGSRADGLIHLGGRQFLSGIGIQAREVHETDDLSLVQGDLLLIYEAGTVTRTTRNLPRLLKWIGPRFSEIVILPTSFDLREPSVRAFVQSWDRRYSVFCRELVSFDQLRKTGAKPKVLLLGHDLAFHMDLTRWKSRPAEGRAGLYRHDREAAYGRLPRKLDKIEDAADGPPSDPEPLLNFVASFEELHTDRCHGAIAAAMMGRRVFFYPNNYFKNRAIYDHSLASLPHVRFVNSTSFSIAQYFRVFYWTKIRPIRRVLGG